MKQTVELTIEIPCIREDIVLEWLPPALTITGGGADIVLSSLLVYLRQRFPEARIDAPWHFPTLHLLDHPRCTHAVCPGPESGRAERYRR